MFFVTKSGTRKRVTEGIRPMIRMVEMTGGIPPSFWNDPIILGFLSGVISGLAQSVSNGKYKGRDTGEITLGVFDDLLGPTDGIAISKRIVALLSDESYRNACMAGYLSVMVAQHGPEKVMDQAIVVEAIAHSKELRAITQSITGPISENASVSSAIQDLVYIRRVDTLRA